MKTIYRVEGTTAYFILKEVDNKVHSAVTDLGFINFEDGFARNFPADNPDLNRIYQNFVSNIEEIILQTAKIHTTPWEKALKKFLTIVRNKDIDWYLAGSTALAVRGIDVVPRDIDLTVAEGDSIKLGNLLAEYLVEPVVPCENWVSNWFGRAFIYARVEWAGGVTAIADKFGTSDFGPTAAKMLEHVKWNGVEIRVPPLELQRQVCERRGLIDRVEKIKQYQKSHSHI